MKKLFVIFAAVLIAAIAGWAVYHRYTAPKAAPAQAPQQEAVSYMQGRMRQRLQEEAFQNRIKAFEGLMADNVPGDKGAIKRALADIHRKLGDFYKASGRGAEAVQAYEKADAASR